MKSLLIGLSIAIFLILSAEYGFSRLEIKPAQYESIAVNASLTVLIVRTRLIKCSRFWVRTKRKSGGAA